MGFWWFMTIMNLLIPFSMIGYGLYFTKHTPKEINYFFGYRTERSMKNMDTWEFSHRYFGKLWAVIGFILLPLSLLSSALVFGDNHNIIGITSLIVCLVQIAAMITPIGFVEKALKKTFDEYGNRR